MTRTLIAGALTFGVLCGFDSAPLLSSMTQTCLSAILSMAGFTVQVTPESLTVASLVIPWHRDCSGASLLTFLGAAVIWVNRQDTSALRFAGRVLLTVPAALLVNVLRVLTIVGYRSVRFPLVEPPEMHFAMTFLWLIPVLWLLMPRQGGGHLERIRQMLTVAVAMSLLAPVVSGPGGPAAALCCLILLGDPPPSTSAGRPSMAAMLLWLTTGVLILLARTNSLWLPWILLSANGLQRRLRPPVGTGLLLMGTVPVLAMQTWWMLLAAVAVIGRQFRAEPGTTSFTSGNVPAARTTTVTGDDSPLSKRVWRRRISRFGVQAVLSGCVLLPILGPMIPVALHPPQFPPVGCIVQPLAPETAAIRLLGQSSEMQIFWFASASGDRHHSLDVCMQFRGTMLSATEVSDVWSDDTFWYREGYLIHDRFVPNYATYLKFTLLPLAPPGAHVIFRQAAHGVPPTVFLRETETRIQQLCRLKSAEEIGKNGRTITTAPSAERHSFFQYILAGYSIFL